MPFLFKIVEFRRGSTRIEFTFSLDTGPGWKTRKEKLKVNDFVSRMYLVTQIRNHFQCLRPLSSLQKADGVALGTMIGCRTLAVRNQHAFRVAGMKNVDAGEQARSPFLLSFSLLANSTPQVASPSRRTEGAPST
jgi:hypothetical protein